MAVNEFSADTDLLIHPGNFFPLTLKVTLPATEADAVIVLVNLKTKVPASREIDALTVEAEIVTVVSVDCSAK